MGNRNKYLQDLDDMRWERYGLKVSLRDINYTYNYLILSVTLTILWNWLENINT